ncbi:MAG: hypothetical protein D6694_11315, partial [Gammaproteobacteria bacterium]
MRIVATVAIIQLFAIWSWSQTTFLKAYYQQNGEDASFNPAGVNQMAFLDSFFAVDSRDFASCDLHIFNEQGKNIQNIQFILNDNQPLYTTAIKSGFGKILFSQSLQFCEEDTPENKCGVVFILDQALNLINARWLQLHTWTTGAAMGFLDPSKALCTYGDYDTLQNASARRVPVVALWDFVQDSVLWAKKYLPQDITLSHGFPTDYTIDNEGMLHFAGYFTAPPAQSPLFLMKLDPQGNFLQGIRFPLYHSFASRPRNILLHYLPDEDAFLLSGRILDPGHHFENPLDANPEGFIAKLNHDYEIEWAYRLHAPYFPCFQLTTIPGKNDDVLFIYTAYGELPVMIGRMDFDGTILWAKGYDFF